MSLEDLQKTFDINDALDAWMKVAKKQREAIPYSQDENFPNILIVLGPHLELATFPVTWESHREKYYIMKAWSEAAKVAKAHAVALVSDTRWTESDDLAAYFKIPDVEQLGLEEFRKRYNEILWKPPYNGEVKNLPRHLWKEAIVIAVKGPTVKLQTRMARYVEGPRDSIEWLGNAPEMEAARFDLLPDWWV